MQVGHLQQCIFGLLPTQTAFRFSLNNKKDITQLVTDEYQIECDCGAIQFRLSGEPRVRGVCHCEDCRELLKIPFHSVTAWEKEAVDIVTGADQIVEFQHPTKRMKRYYCGNCGETLFNSNAMDWRVVSQLLIRKNYGNELPEALRSKSHFHYGERIVDIDDDLPKRD